MLSIMATVFRKTSKGQQEIETRAHGLLPKLRTALILVDGRRDEDALRKMIPGDPDATIKTLIDDGYIEAMEVVTEKPRPVAKPDSGPPSRPAVSNPKTFEQHRQAAVRMINDTLGPSGESAALKIERCKTWDELQPALEFARSILANARGAQAAEDFRRQFIESRPT